jgi:hypothetical protein
MLVGAILAAKNLDRCPRACMALFGALGLTLINNLATPILMTIWMQQSGAFSRSNNPMIWQIVTVLPFSIIGAISWGLLLFAIFDGRAHITRYSLEEDPDRDILDR